MLQDAIVDDAEAEIETESDRFWAIMDRLGTARSMLNVCFRSLSKGDSPAAGDEAEVLAEVIEKLRVVYNDFDGFAQTAFPDAASCAQDRG